MPSVFVIGPDGIPTDGEEALQLLNSKPFDLVLLDIMMPKVNG
jgi:CheY-like chemotaxis protein